MVFDNKIPMQIQLETLDDLLRWIISSSENQHGTIFYSVQNDKHVYSSYLVFSNYFDYKGLPVHGYVIHSEKPRDSFLRYDIRINLNDSDQLSFISGFDESETSLGYIQYFPIINLKNIPEIFKITS